MKRILSLIAFSILFALPSFAQTRALATLSHEGQLRFFDNVSAFEDAVDAAVSGDIIYLSEGKFGASKSSFILKDKKISIIGCGYKSHIIPKIIIENGSFSVLKFTMPLFDGVRLEKLSFSGNSNKKIDNIEIKKCKIDSIYLSDYINNVRLDRCNIKNYLNRCNCNINLHNCKINEFDGFNCELMENCNIKRISGYGPAYIINSIIETLGNNLTRTNAHATFENCLIFKKEYFVTSYNVYRNTYAYTTDSKTTTIFYDNLNCRIPDMSHYVGTDGTVIGVYGGQWFPYSETPSVPTVDSSKSSVEYDKETNKLNVTITVAPN